MICEKCGEDVQGIIQWSTHPCNLSVIEYSGMDDNDIRQSFLEIGMPTIAFTALDFAPPTEMERIIFQKEQ